MPTAAKRPCRCGKLTSRKLCEACESRCAPGRLRQTAARRGYGYRWQRASRAYLAAHPLCVDPHGDHEGRVVAASCTDHIVAHKGDMSLFWDEANWQPLCAACHARKTALEDGGFGRAG